MMKDSVKKIIGIGIASAAVIAAGAFFALRTHRAEPVIKDVYALDTFCAITVYAGNGDLSEAADRAAMVLRRYDALFDANREGSDIWNINHRSEAQVRISAETADMLTQAKEMETFTGGALWPGIRPLTKLWDIKNRTTVPKGSEVADALHKSQNASWEIRGAEVSGGEAYFAAGNEETEIDPGAFAKGYIADRMKEELVSAGVTSAIIDLGGNIQTVGKNTDGTPFRIGVKDPSGKEAAVTALEADDISVVTAGTYERYFEADGVRYHHILDPDTGYPARSGLASVTVSGPSSFVCDCLATAALVLGRDKAEAMLSAWNAAHQTDYKAFYIEE